MSFDAGNSSFDLDSLFSLENIWTSSLYNKASKLIKSNFKFSSEFFERCQIFLKIIRNNCYLFIEFPQNTPKNPGKTVYFPENLEFPLLSALKSDEILHNGDLDFTGSLITYSEESLSNHSVSFSNNPGVFISLVISIESGTFSSNVRKTFTNRRGNKSIIGVIKMINKESIFKNKPKFFIEKEILVSPATHTLIYQRLPLNYPCEPMQNCYNLIKNHFNLDYFNIEGNRCYCNKCFPEDLIEFQEINNKNYTIPRGWCRFGLKTSL